MKARWIQAVIVVVFGCFALTMTGCDLLDRVIVDVVEPTPCDCEVSSEWQVVVGDLEDLIDSFGD